MPILLQFKLLRACIGNIMLLLSILLLHDKGDRAVTKEGVQYYSGISSQSFRVIRSQNSAQYCVGNLNFNCKLYQTFV